jgi:DNA-directed RNA polymerase specialized sigma24 family protein
LPARVATDHGPLPDELAAGEELTERAARAIATLPADERCVLMEALHGAKLAESAEARGRSAAWVRVKLRAAQEKVSAAVMGKAA